ncbi:epididymal-specific lipocalin-9-like [Antechinus flavipes]|uniref:epididymal-specific lipocalin-9-like n=1 Tax=Antechinus flavipes TaxID=38775 RepID=UPI002235C281|nr:epididymal-specific lipocalin-9-like [Antechinus flavipes]
MKINLLLSLGLVLISALHAHGLVYDKNADWQEFSGEWRSILLASSDASRIKNGGDMKLFINKIKSHNDNVVFDVFSKEGEKCVSNAITAEKEKDSNVLHVPYGGENRIYIYRSDRNKAFILITINIQDGIKTIIIELYGRPTYDVSKKLITDYYNVCKHHGIPEDNIIDMTKEDECYRNKEQ